MIKICEMKTKVFLFFLSICLLNACEEKKFDGEVVFGTIDFIKNGSEIDPDTTKHYEAQIKYYNIVEAPEYLKDSINKQTKVFLSNWFDVPQSGELDIDQIITNDLRSFYEQIDSLDDNDCLTCRTKKIKIEGDNFYQNRDLISISYKWYIYEGGAHGNYGEICYNYEKATGKKINYKALIKNEDEFLKLALKTFKEQHSNGASEPISDIFNFENNKFHLTNNFSFTKDGIIFYYNPYEIAPYALGLIELFLPYDQLNGLINYINHIQ